jgi:hypothetical protein
MVRGSARNRGINIFKVRKTVKISMSHETFQICPETSQKILPTTGNIGIISVSYKLPLFVWSVNIYIIRVSLEYEKLFWGLLHERSWETLSYVLTI